MLARSFDRASKSIIDASVGAQKIVSAIRDVSLPIYRASKVLAAPRFIAALRSCLRARRRARSSSHRRISTSSLARFNTAAKFLQRSTRYAGRNRVGSSCCVQCSLSGASHARIHHGAVTSTRFRNKQLTQKGRLVR